MARAKPRKATHPNWALAAGWVPPPRGGGGILAWAHEKFWPPHTLQRHLGVGVVGPKPPRWQQTPPPCPPLPTPKWCVHRVGWPACWCRAPPPPAARCQPRPKASLCLHQSGNGCHPQAPQVAPVPRFGRTKVVRPIWALGPGDRARAWAGACEEGWKMFFFQTGFRAVNSSFTGSVGLIIASSRSGTSFSSCLASSISFSITKNIYFS